MNLPVIDLVQLSRLLSTLRLFSRAYSDLWTEDVIAAARPILPLLGYDGPDAASIFSRVDAVEMASSAIGENSGGQRALRDALQTVRHETAIEIAKLFEHALDTASRQADAERTLVSDLAASVNANAPKVAPLPLRSVK